MSTKNDHNGPTIVTYWTCEGCKHHRVHGGWSIRTCTAMQRDIETTKKRTPSWCPLLPKDRIEVGIYGGSFDPPTFGHETVLKNVSKYFDLILTICSYSHPFNKKLTPHEDRVHMCKLMIENLKVNNVNNVEATSIKDSGTYLTMKELITIYPNYNFTFIMGQDCANDFPKWRNYRELMELIPFMVLGRQGYNANDQDWYKKGHHRYMPKLDGIPISSTKIRNMIENKEDPTEFLNPNIWDYIQKKGFYRA